MKKKCPLNQNKTYHSGRNTGAGYPDYWEEHTSFGECIGEDCAFWYENSKCCALKKKAPDTIFSKEFE